MKLSFKLASSSTLYLWLKSTNTVLSLLLLFPKQKNLVAKREKYPLGYLQRHHLMPIPYSESDQVSRVVAEHHCSLGRDESEPLMLPDLQCGPNGAEGRRDQKCLF